MKLANSPRVKYVPLPPEPELEECGAARPRRRVALLSVAVLVALSVLIGIALVRRPALPPGGLDGCLVSAGGTPMVAEVTVGGLTRSTGPDGCFFFPSLPAGDAELWVQGAIGEWRLPVTVVSGEATGLGELQLP